MKCCRKELTNPEIIDGTAYFVCPDCGDVFEVQNYRVYTNEEALSYFKEMYGFTLPREYVKLSESEETKVVELPHCENEPLKYYFGEGFYEIGTFVSVNPNSEKSIYNSINSGRDWGLPKTHIPLEGDGHTWLALDYSNSLTEPKVIVTETDGGNSLVLAHTFAEFLSSLLQYEEVYDLDGNVTRPTECGG